MVQKASQSEKATSGKGLGFGVLLLNLQRNSLKWPTAVFLEGAIQGQSI